MHTSLLYDGDDLVSEIVNGTATNTIQSPFVDEPIARGGLYLTPNHLGSTTTLTDSNGNVAEQYFYLPFGQTWQSAGTSNPFQFTGRENDGTGFYWNRSRYYSPDLGRFISEDRLGAEANAYAYAGDDPVNLTDPEGYDGSSPNAAPPPYVMYPGAFSPPGEAPPPPGFSVGPATRPWLVLDLDLLSTLSESLVATGDGILPFWHPGAAAGYYNPNDPWRRFSYTGGQVGRDVGLAAVIPNLKVWAENPLAYEIGQKTLPDAAYEAYKGLGAIERGRALIRDLGWLRALRPTAGGLRLGIGKTFLTGPTPGAWLLLEGGAQYVDSWTWRRYGLR